MQPLPLDDQRHCAPQSGSHLKQLPSSCQGPNAAGDRPLVSAMRTAPEEARGTGRSLVD